MSLFFAGGRSATSRRFSQVGLHNVNSPMQWPSPATLRNANISLKGRRRALDLYDVKDILFSHEQIKKTRQSNSYSRNDQTFGWVRDLYEHLLEDDQIEFFSLEIPSRKK